MKNILDTAVDAGHFTTLLAATRAAGLSSMLSGKGLITLFAPTDAAFKKLPAGTVDGLLKDIPKLKSILMHHVVSGKLACSDIASGELKSIEGSAITTRVEGTDVTVNGAKVTGAEVEATNGIIHAIDAVFASPGSKPVLAAVA
jgi:uncharacterized surface protein with fasciclin (FAS1) repeats